MTKNQTPSDDFRQAAEDGENIISLPLMAKIEAALRKAGGDLAETALWEMVAAESSSLWVHARERLDAEEAELKDRLSPENVPLGLIGSALDGGDLDRVRERHTQALMQFTMLNENMRQDPKLKSAMKNILALKAQIEESQRLSREALALTVSFGRKNRKNRPARAKKDRKGLLGRLFATFSHQPETSAAPEKPVTPVSPPEMK